MIPAALPLAEITFSDESSPTVPSNLLADDFDHAHDLRSLLTGLPARPGTLR